MTELQLKYGCNPNQTPSRIFVESGELPIEVLNGRAGYINFMDALNGWQLVKELREATGLPSATSFKHVSPAGAGVGLELSEVLKKIYRAEDVIAKYGELSPLANAYARARGADRMSSYGDFIALSDKCDEITARLIQPQVSDGVIAPDYDEKALEILKSKRGGNYTIIKINPDYRPASLERRNIYGITFEQGRNELKINEELLKNVVTANKTITKEAKLDLIIALITLKYTQSNSVAYAFNGQAIGIGAGQQSRIHCTRLAGNKADNWFLRQAPNVLELPFKSDLKPADMDNATDVYIGAEYEDVLKDGEWEKYFTRKPEVFTEAQKKDWLSKINGISLASDAFFPFGDNIERARKSGVSFIAQPGGSIRDDNVIETCDKYNIAMAFTGIRLFHH